VFEYRVLGRIFGIKGMERQDNEELHILYSHSNIKVIRSRRIGEAACTRKWEML
jgi:hypothetical protein